MTSANAEEMPEYVCFISRSLRAKNETSFVRSFRRRRRLERNWTEEKNFSFVFRPTFEVTSDVSEGAFRTDRVA